MALQPSSILLGEGPFFLPRVFGVTKMMHAAVTWTCISVDMRESVTARKVTEQQPAWLAQKKIQNIVIVIYSGKKGDPTKSQNAKCLLDTINANDLYLSLSLLWDWTWHFCCVAVAYVGPSGDVYPKQASGFPQFCSLFLQFPSPQSQAFTSICKFHPSLWLLLLSVLLSNALDSM
jgi:hypothetical protein